MSVKQFKSCIQHKPCKILQTCKVTFSLGSALDITHRPGCRIHSPLSSKKVMASDFCSKILGNSKPWAFMVSRTARPADVDSMSYQHKTEKKAYGYKKANAMYTQVNGWKDANQ